MRCGEHEQTVEEGELRNGYRELNETPSKLHSIKKSGRTSTKHTNALKSDVKGNMEENSRPDTSHLLLLTAYHLMQQMQTAPGVCP